MVSVPADTLLGWIKRAGSFGWDQHPIPGLPLRGKRVLIRSFQRSDEDVRQRWAKFQDPYLLKYNFTPRGTFENDITYQKLKDRVRLAVENQEEQVIGYVSLKPVKGDVQSAELGICFAADQVSKGYGSETLKLILDWAREVLKVQRVELEVDALNLRAIKLYENFGFRKVGEFWRKDDHPALFAYCESSNRHPHIRRRKNRIELLSWKMEWKSENQSR
jgi:RimJ/RimL family protein N-acetyltransferase